MALIEASEIEIWASGATILELSGQELGLWGHNPGFRAKIGGFEAKV